MSKKKTCKLCLSNEDNELKYGKLFKSDELTVHHFCLLFGPACMQNGDDDEGFEGFLPEDIKKEIKRVKRIKCVYCKKLNANLGCCVSSCHAAYHTNCAWKNDVVFEFTSKFQTFCKNHKEVRQEEKKKLDSACAICFEKTTKKFRSILIPCCKNAWFHRKCLQQYALNAGLFYKCPLCGDKESKASLKLLGIFFPTRDAAWELEENAFSEFVQPLQLYCESERCTNKTKYFTEEWKWKLCSHCGANGQHLSCFEGKENDTFTCNECTRVIKKVELEKKFRRQRTWISDEEVLSSDEDENIRPPPRKVLKVVDFNAGGGSKQTFKISRNRRKARN